MNNLKDELKKSFNGDLSVDDMRGLIIKVEEMAISESSSPGDAMSENIKWLLSESAKRFSDKNDRKTLENISSILYSIIDLHEEKAPEIV